MRYQGGKSRISKPIAMVLSSKRGGAFVSLFCGTCSIESKVTGYDRKILNDKHKYLIALLREIQNGYEPPTVVTESDYKYIKAHKDENEALAGFVGFGCSFGGKWFGGYARNKQGTNYADQSKRSLLRDMATLSDAEFTCEDYRDVYLPDKCVIYADPPYANTTTYSGEAFDSDAFWEYARTVSQSHVMFISEQTAPEDFVAIWEQPVKRMLDRNGDNRFAVTEKLFVHKCNADLFQSKEDEVE